MSLRCWSMSGLSWQLGTFGGYIGDMSQLYRCKKQLLLGARSSMAGPPYRAKWRGQKKSLFCHAMSGKPTQQGTPLLERCTKRQDAQSKGTRW